ncbi:DUF167 domain-containing protein [Desulfothermobacter acidiphilus]|uniref:DUF167 domain-containing protein n=1 Tax=Desulfothermobacter acidiphilus TaxID=1938353 RepID=UPI003F892AC1
MEKWEGALQAAEKGTLLRLRVTPRSRVNALEVSEGSLRVRLIAPPVEGKANELLLGFLSQLLDLPARRMELVGGHKSREKLVWIDLTLPEVRQRLAEVLRKKER